MGTAVGTFSARTNHRIRLETQLASQNVAGNYSTLNWQIYAEKTAASSSYYLSNGGGGSVNIGGNGIGIGAWQYDFRSNSIYLLGSGSVNVGHNPDGTLSYSFSASITAPGSLGSASCSAAEALPTIARATQPTVTPSSGPTGVAYSIGMNAASGSFYHDLFYSLDGGASYTSLASDIPASTTGYNWTPANTLFPNSSGVTAIILLRTRASSGGTIIGDKTVGLSLSVPSSLIPVVSNVTWADAQISSPDIPTLMGGAGRFLQQWSRLVPAVTSSGAGGSTVVSSLVTQNGQVTPSGVAFSLPSSLSGTVPFSAVATDSRNRTSDVYVNTVDVKAYNFPRLPTPLVGRTSDAAGAVPSPTGTYLVITPLASVSSLVFGGVEKNLLEWQIRIKPVGGSFTVVQAWTTATVSGNTWTTKFVAPGPYASSTEYVVEVSIRDLFGKSGFNVSSTVTTLTVPVPSESVFMDWDGNNGFGLGKYRANGMLDVAGLIYQNNGQLVMDQGNADSLLPGRLRPSNNLGSGPNPDTLTSSGSYSGYNWTGSLSGYSIGTLQVVQYSPDWITQVFILVDRSPLTLTRARYSGTTWGPWRRTIQDDEGGLAEKLSLGSGWFWYHDVIAANDVNSTYSPPFAYRSSSGFVQLHGLLYNTNAPAAAGAIMLNLPAAYRPLQRWRGLVWASGNQMGVIVETNGDVKLEYALANTGLVSLSGIKFNNDAGLARTAMTLQGAWVAMGVGEGTPQYALDSVGRVLLEGAIKNGLSSSDAWLPPVGARWTGAGALVHSWEQASANRLARWDMPSSPVASPYPLHSQVTASGSVTSTGRSLDLNYVRDGFGFNTAGMLGAWVNYGSGWNAAAYTKLADGAGKAKGLIANGAMGTAALQTPLSYAPKYRLLFYADCTDAPGRIDIDPTGTVYPMTGANGFVSLEGLEWVPKNFTP